MTAAYPLDIARTNIASRAGAASAAVASEWAGIVQTLRALTSEHGASFLLRGLFATQLCQGLNIGLHFAIYETLNTHFMPRDHPQPNERQRSSFAYSMLCGAISGLVASTLVQPLDLIRRRQQLCAGQPTSDWFFTVGARILRQGGPVALYRGLAPELVKVCLFPASGLNFYVYELVRQEVFGQRSGVR